MNKLAVILTAAACATASYGSTQVPRDRTIVQMLHYDSYTVIEYTPPYATTEGCGGEVQYPGFVAISAASDPYRTLVTSAMSAFAGGKTVGFGLSGCFGWGGGLPIVYRVDQVESN
jgi:hypothetical protein